MEMPILSILLFYLVAVAIGAFVLYVVVRAAVLSALRAHRAELESKAPSTSYLDADGL